MTHRTGLLDRSVSYAVSAVHEVTPALLPCPTPCRRWDLEMLIRHACESMTAFREGFGTGCVDLVATPPENDPATNPAQIFRERAGQLLAEWNLAGRQRRVVGVADLPLPVFLLEYAAALEIAIHGWDISQACGHGTPIPRGLAADLLPIALLLVPETGRQPLFGPPVTVASGAGPSDQLVAFVGREPRQAGPGQREGSPQLAG